MMEPEECKLKKEPAPESQTSNKNFFFRSETPHTLNPQKMPTPYLSHYKILRWNDSSHLKPQIHSVLGGPIAASAQTLLNRGLKQECEKYSLHTKSGL